MSYHPLHRSSGIRWREDTGLEKRCDSCPPGLRYWPLTEEFWSFRQSFVRCKACHAKAKYQSERRSYAKNAARRLAQLDYQKKYRQETKGARRIKNLQAYWADPEGQRARAKARYYANREAILERKRLKYWAEKAA